MKFTRFVFAAWCTVVAAHADLTLRHTFTARFGSFLPPQALDSQKAQWANRMPESTTTLIKGDRVCITMGPMLAVTDYAKGEITLIDPPNRRFATVLLADYPAKLAAAQKALTMPPDAQRIFDKIQFDVTSARSAQSVDIHGIRTTEDTLTMKMELMAGMQFRTEIHLWTAAPDDLRKTPQLRELAAYLERPKAGLDPAEAMDKLLDSLPGMGERLRAPMRQIRQDHQRAVIRTRVSTFMPSAPGTPSTPSEPVIDIGLDLADLSLAPVPDSRFAVPAGFHTAAMEDLLAALFPAPQSTPVAMPKPQIPPGETVRVLPSETSGSGRIYRVGNGVSAPSILYRIEPSYSEAARAARIQGSVLLQLVVLPDGTASQIKVARSLDAGLDQKAVEAVSQWKFKPAMKDGQAVAVQSTIEVTFHLM